MDNATTDPDNARELKAALAERIWVSICACEECEPFARAVLDYTNALAEDDLRFQTIAASYEGAAAEVIRDYFEFCVGVGGDVAWDLLRRRHVNLANASADEYITLTLLDALAYNARYGRLAGASYR